jgi:hypothetical protein
MLPEHLEDVRRGVPLHVEQTVMVELLGQRGEAEVGDLEVLRLEVSVRDTTTVAEADDDENCWK